MKRWITTFILFLILAACSPASNQSLPTLMVLPTLEPTSASEQPDNLTSTVQVKEFINPPTLIPNDKLNDDLTSAYNAVPGVYEVTWLSLTGTNPAYIYLEVDVEPIYKNELMANDLRKTTTTTLIDRAFEFTVVLNDAFGSQRYAWDNIKETWGEKPAPTATRKPAATPNPITNQNTFTCPSNCTQARAMGLSASEAAACGLDRDGDGVACYGD